MNKYFWMLSFVLAIVSVESTPTVIASCTDIATFAEGLAPTSEIHVDPSGSDTEGDGSAQSPFATIRHAVNLAVPGTAVIIHPGIYSGSVNLYDVTGTSSAPIWIGGAAGESRPIIEGGTEAIHFFRGKYIILHDMEIRNADINGINCDDGGDYSDPIASHHLLFKNLYIHDIGGTSNQDCLKLSGIRDYFVLNCQFERCGGGASGSGIDMVGCHRGLIACSDFQQMSGNAIQCKGGSEDVEIRWCRIREGGQRGINMGGSTGFEFFRPPLSTSEENAEARNIRVISNIIEDTVAAFAFVGCVDSIASNNTIVNPTQWIFRILQETASSEPYIFLPCGNNRVENNLVYFNSELLGIFYIASAPIPIRLHFLFPTISGMHTMNPLSPHQTFL